MSVMRPDLIMKSVIPVVMAGIIAIYGLVVSVLIANKCKCPCVCIINMCRGVVTIFPNKVYFHDGIAFLKYREFDLVVYPI